ncbi:hypothetical protein [Achromobacter animicus]|uniref:hypothetical protein n=1 Tax=Achromobacter animicus TaxID=1389935 RepID=UPI0028AC78E4|nr:hypothetical protein [Achromobacter animicus]
MNIISPWANKCPVGTRARHARLGDVTVLADCGDSREVESVSLDGEGHEVRAVELVLASELSAIDPCRDLAPPRATAATVLPFRASSLQ